MRDSINAAIAGATGYIGLELIKILSRHPKTNITYLCAQKSLGKKISIFDNKIKSKKLPKVSKIEHINWKKVDIIFTALPNGEAYKIAQIKPTNVKLIDLSADFRLDSFRCFPLLRVDFAQSTNLTLISRPSLVGSHCVERMIHRLILFSSLCALVVGSETVPDRDSSVVGDIPQSWQPDHPPSSPTLCGGDVPDDNKREFLQCVGREGVRLTALAVYAG